MIGNMSVAVYVLIRYGSPPLRGLSRVRGSLRPVDVCVSIEESYKSVSGTLTKPHIPLIPGKWDVCSSGKINNLI